MRIPILTFGAIASVLTINSAFADTTVTSKTYVDTTRQATIPVSGTNAATPGTTVVTYTGTAGQIGERGIFNPATDFDNTGGVASGHEGDLVTAGLVVSGLNQVYDALEEVGDMPTTTVAYKTCYQWSGTPHTDANCLLWNLGDKTVYGERQCTNNSDCPGACNFCNNGQCIIDNEHCLN